MLKLEDIINNSKALEEFLIGIAKTVKDTYTRAYEKAEPKREPRTQPEDDDYSYFSRRRPKPRKYRGLSSKAFAQLQNPDSLQLPTALEEISYQLYRTEKGSYLNYKPFNNLNVKVKVYKSMNFEVYLRNPFKPAPKHTIKGKHKHEQIDKNKEWLQDLRNSLSTNIKDFVNRFIRRTANYQDNESTEHTAEKEPEITKVIRYSDSTPPGLLKEGTQIYGFSPEDIKATDGKLKEHGKFCLSMGTKHIILDEMPDTQNPTILITGGVNYFIRKGKLHNG